MYHRFSEPRFSEPRFSDPHFSETLDLMNELQLPFFLFYSLSRLDLMNKKGLTTLFTKSSFGCTLL